MASDPFSGLFLLRHELTHALQHCTSLMTGTCDDCLDREVDAYMRSELCKPGNPWIWPGEDECDCVARLAAWGSCKKECEADWLKAYNDALKMCKDRQKGRPKP